MDSHQHPRNGAANLRDIQRGKRAKKRWQTRLTEAEHSTHKNRELLRNCPETCRRKHGWPTEADANTALAHMMIEKHMDNPPEAYQCPNCKLWYLGRIVPDRWR